MDANNQIPSFEIPKSAEQAPVYSGGLEYDPQLSVEGTREILPAPVGMPAAQGQVLDPVSQPVSPSTGTVQPLQGVQPIGAQSDAHLIAEDIDVIEKEWVDRARKIIALTATDPYTEAKEMSKLKATYIKKRFNKDITLASDKTT
jgi:hypothetical protein